MTKKFNDFTSAIEWGKEVIERGKRNALPTVAEQVYKDSDEFTYRDTGDMYKSGETHSYFDEGMIIERMPYVRRRYYEGGTAGVENLKAQPRWFEKTVSKYNKEYKKIIIDSINNAKKG